MNVAAVSSTGTLLTDEQLAAVDSDAPALVVKSPAGTGKTEVLVRRAEKYVSNPATGHKRVLVVTYTTRAAEEFTARLRDRIGTAMERLTAETLHGFCQSLLSVHGGHVGLPLDFQVIARDEDRAELLAKHDKTWSIEDSSQLFRDLDLARARVEEHPRLTLWRSALKDAGAVDYADMITKATSVLRIPAIAAMQRNIYGMVLIDEAQNLTPQQYEFIAALIGRRPDSGAPQVLTTLLGDPNQLVTGFAGGDSSQTDRFATDFGAEQLHLTRNFRSSQRLAHIEKAVAERLSHNGHSLKSGKNSEVPIVGAIEIHEFDDELGEGEFVANWANRLLTEGLPPDAKMSEEAGGIEPEDIAVLARHGASLGHVSQALTKRGHEVAQAHNGDDLMSTREGRTALLMMRSRSDQHRMEATAELSRAFNVSLTKPQEIHSSDANTEVSESLQAAGLGHLLPLLGADSPTAFITALDDCLLPDDDNDTLLSGWTADCGIFSQAWSEFADVTPVSDRSWARFCLHFDRMARGRDLGSGIRLLTVHKAQAREFMAVAVVAMNEGQFPDFRATTSEQQTAELQAFYVAVTRASRVLLLTRSRRRTTSYGYRTTEPSPFIKLAGQSLDRCGT